MRDICFQASNKYKKIIITGSDASHLNKELALLMIGKHVENELLPFTFNEFLDFEKIDTQNRPSLTTLEKVKAISALERYLISGGLPFAIKLRNAYLAILFRGIVQRDFFFRLKIRFQEKMKELARYLISNSTSEISYRRIGSVLKFSSKSTVQNWISYLQKEKAKLSNSYQINYWKDYSGIEVYFVIRNGRTINTLINVTSASSIDEINAREIGALLMASRELRCNKLQIVSCDYSNEETFEGNKIKFIPIWRWLLQ